MLRLIDVFVIEFLGLVAGVVDGSLVAVVGIVGRVVIVTIYNGLAGLAYSKIARLCKQLA
jgi:RNase P/RNase MRP subunit p29